MVCQTQMIRLPDAFVSKPTPTSFAAEPKFKTPRKFLVGASLLAKAVCQTQMIHLN